MRCTRRTGMSIKEEIQRRRMIKKREEQQDQDTMVCNPGVKGYIADIIFGIILFLAALICVVPMWHVFMASVSDGKALLGHAGMLWKPLGEATLAGYKLLFADSSIVRGFLNSMVYVAGGTALGLLVNIFAGYILSRPTKFRTAMILFCMFTTMFNGGTVPTYMVIKNLGMTGTPWSLIIPNCTNAMFMLMMMQSFSNVDKAYVEAAELDGAGHLQIMFNVMLPQCKGMAMVTAVQTAIMKWNAWFDASIYVPNNKEYWPLQLWVKQIMAQADDFLKVSNPNYDKNLLQYAAIIAATLPIILAFPFFIRKLEKGMVMGGVKG